MKTAPERIYLVGYMGSGKTTIGRRLASRLDFKFIDLDQRIEEENHMSINTIFDRFGEPHFRDLERVALFDTFKLNKLVVATGGGTPCFFDNMQQIVKNGLSIYIQLPVAVLADRLTNARNSRPLIKEHADLKSYINEMLNVRMAYYNQAHIIVDGLNLQVDNLMNLIKISTEY